MVLELAHHHCQYWYLIVHAGNALQWDQPPKIDSEETQLLHIQHSDTLQCLFAVASVIALL